MFSQKQMWWSRSTSINIVKCVVAMTCSTMSALTTWCLSRFQPSGKNLCNSLSTLSRVGHLTFPCQQSSSWDRRVDGKLLTRIESPVHVFVFLSLLSHLTGNAVVSGKFDWMNSEKRRIADWKTPRRMNTTPNHSAVIIFQRFEAMNISPNMFP